jgi:hypothetical protein
MSARSLRRLATVEKPIFLQRQNLDQIQLTAGLSRISIEQKDARAPLNAPNNISFGYGNGAATPKPGPRQDRFLRLSPPKLVTLVHMGLSLSPMD